MPIYVVGLRQSLTANPNLAIALMGCVPTRLINCNVLFLRLLVGGNAEHFQIDHTTVQIRLTADSTPNPSKVWAHAALSC